MNADKRQRQTPRGRQKVNEMGDIMDVLRAKDLGVTIGMIQSLQTMHKRGKQGQGGLFAFRLAVSFSDPEVFGPLCVTAILF